MLQIDRAVLATLVLAIGLNETFAGITGIENAVSGDTTLFEQVLSMVTTYDPKSWRAIDSKAMAIASGVVITITHFVSGVLCRWASIQLGITKRNSAPHDYVSAKMWATAGLGVGSILYLLGFVAIAGGWFQLWQSQTVNFIPEAQMLLFSYMFVLVFSRHVE